MSVEAVANTSLTKEQILALTEDDIVSAYEGKPGCACGCIGAYFYNPAHQEYGSKKRGYAVTDADCNIDKVRSILKDIQMRAVDLPDGFILNTNKSVLDNRNREWCIGEFWVNVEPSSIKSYSVYIKEPVGCVHPWDNIPTTQETE